MVIFNGALLWHFHDRYWYPTDDGLYAHIAERLLAGDVLNKDIQDIHPGYIHLVNAAAFRLFGLDLVTLRYPLVIASFLEACLVFALFQRRSLPLAVAGSVASIALGVVQFVDPNPNWYCLTFCLALVCWLTWVPRDKRGRLVVAGILLGLLTLFRQLSGVWAAMGLLTYLLMERSNDARGRETIVARGLLLIMLAAIGWYLVVSPETEPGGTLLMAVWPIAILGWGLVHTRTDNRQTAALVGELLIGCAVAAVPLAAYHVWHGSIAGWINDTVLAAFGETQMPFFGHGWYGVLPLAALVQLGSTIDPVKIANSLYWLVLPLVSVFNGLLILSRLRRRPRDVGELALPILAAFYAMGSLYFEGPLYLYYTVGLSVLSTLWLASAAARPMQRAATVLAAGLSVVAIVFHAGQTRLRTPIEILEGRRVSDVWSAGDRTLPRCTLRLDPADRDVYGRLVSFVQDKTEPGDSILTLPNDAELYFLAGRHSPVRFYNSALGIRTDAELKDVMHELTARPPRLVAFRPDDKYNTDATRTIMEFVKQGYILTGEIDGLEFYRKP